MEPTGMVYGYARVSTKKSKSRRPQHAENQETRLRAAGAVKVYTDEYTGKAKSRPEWDKLLAVVEPGDTLLFTKLDRIGRSLANLVQVMTDLHQRGVHLRSLDSGIIDTTTAQGKMLFGILAVLAEFEAELTRERTLEGLDAARERHGGMLPPRGPSITDDQLTRAAELAATTDMNAAAIAEAVGVSRATLYRHVDVAGLRSGAA
jgi:DNA invertase Pin-like site-specific DNA recombinase